MLRVATLNQFQPGLSSDDLSDVGQPVNGGAKGSKANVWEALRGWGQRLYRKADIVFLTEVRHEPIRSVSASSAAFAESAWITCWSSASDKRQLYRVIRGYVDYFNRSRPH
jgi:hypothetical protein